MRLILQFLRADDRAVPQTLGDHRFSDLEDRLCVQTEDVICETRPGPQFLEICTQGPYAVPHLFLDALPRSDHGCRIGIIARTDIPSLIAGFRAVVRAGYEILEPDEGMLEELEDVVIPALEAAIADWPENTVLVTCCG